MILTTFSIEVYSLRFVFYLYEAPVATVRKMARQAIKVLVRVTTDTA